MFDTSDESAIYPSMFEYRKIDGCAHASRWHAKNKNMIAGLLVIYMIEAYPKTRLKGLKLHFIIDREERINVHS